MHTDIVLRPYQADDLPAVIDLWAVTFPDEPAHNDPARLIGLKLSVQPELFFVAVQGEDIVGTVIAGFDGVRGWVHKLAVHPDVQRGGIAARLMSAAEDGLRALGCAKLNIQVRGTNAAAVAFYERAGYVVEDRVSLGKPLI